MAQIDKRLLGTEVRWSGLTVTGPGEEVDSGSGTIRGLCDGPGEACFVVQKTNNHFRTVPVSWCWVPEHRIGAR